MYVFLSRPPLTTQVVLSILALVVITVSRQDCGERRAGQGLSHLATPDAPASGVVYFLATGLCKILQEICVKFTWYLTSNAKIESIKGNRVDDAGMEN
jgi:hypothetical protein